MFQWKDVICKWVRVKCRVIIKEIVAFHFWSSSKSFICSVFDLSAPSKIPYTHIVRQTKSSNDNKISRNAPICNGNQRKIYVEIETTTDHTILLFWIRTCANANATQYKELDIWVMNAQKYYCVPVFRRNYSSNVSVHMCERVSEWGSNQRENHDKQRFRAISLSKCVFWSKNGW